MTKTKIWNDKGEKQLKRWVFNFLRKREVERSATEYKRFFLSVKKEVNFEIYVADRKATTCT